MNSNQIFFYSLTATALSVAACGMQEKTGAQKKPDFQINYTPTAPAGPQNNSPQGTTPDAADQPPSPLPSDSAHAASSSPLPQSPLPQPPSDVAPAPAAPRPVFIPTRPLPPVPWRGPWRTPLPRPTLPPVAIATQNPTPATTPRPQIQPSRAPFPTPRPTLPPVRPQGPPTPFSPIVAPSSVQLRESGTALISFVGRSADGVRMRRRARCRYEPCVLRMSFQGESGLVFNAPAQSAGHYDVVLEAVDARGSLSAFAVQVQVQKSGL